MYLYLSLMTNSFSSTPFGADARIMTFLCSRTGKPSGRCVSIHRSLHQQASQENTSYKLREHVLDVVDCNMYLGVNINKDLSCYGRSCLTTPQQRPLGFLRRNFRYCSTEVRSSVYMYNAMVQPTLDYASTTLPWTLTPKRDINTLNKVHHRGARVLCDNYTDRTHGCVTDMLNSIECKMSFD